MQCGFQQEGEKKPPGISTDLAIKGTKDVETMQTLHVYSVRDQKG